MFFANMHKEMNFKPQQNPYIFPHCCVIPFKHRQNLHSNPIDMQDMNKQNFEGSRPKWCISSTICSGDTPFWLEILEIVLQNY